MGRLDNKVAMVSGGAMGIGEADCLLFAREGAQVLIADVNEAAGRKLEAAIRGEGLEATYVKLDVSKEADWVAAMETAVTTYGKLNILVNNAGVSLGKDVEETTLEEWNWLLGINATGVFLGIKHAIATMKGNGENCSIVNRSSIDGQIAEAGLFAYCSSKG
ncbi:MAG: SDR family NAD(P)-dependent oxidoreductase, partial [Propionibacteriaceae bacterium]|nr:SDR family NAD(P)-dependent oxidoreductase [Propionibacteriaceae bacterium]